MQRRFVIEWNSQEIAQALQVTVQDVQEYFTDGRRVSFLIERRLMWDHPGWRLAPSEGAGFDLIDPENREWEVRSITKGGVYFNPSGQVGSGRKFGEEGFLAKLDGVAGFILSDITTFPRVEVVVVPCANVRRWYHAGMLGTNARVSRPIWRSRLLNDIRYDDGPESVVRGIARG